MVNFATRIFAMDIVGYLLAVLVGVSLGLIGSGGSILTVPILVYIMGVDAESATAYSLFIVGCTALAGGIQNAVLRQVDFNTVLLFGIPSILAVYATRLLLLPLIPDPLFSTGVFTITKPVALLLLFAVVMVMAAVGMIRNGTGAVTEAPAPRHTRFIAKGIVVGLLTGLVGAGGGFLIIPALVITGRMPMKKAIGSSLFIVAINSATGFTGDLIHGRYVNWQLVLLFTLCALAGITAGMLLSKKIAGSQLKKGFGWFVLVMGTYIIVKELFL
jgi:uncharacterized protein